MPAMKVPSAAMRRLRRDGLEISRRRAALAPTGGVVGKARKPSPPPQYVVVLALPAPAPRSNPNPAPTAPSIPPAPRRAGRGGAPPERARPTPSSAAASPRSSHAAAPAKPVEAVKIIGKGAQVRVRTRVATARTGQPIVFWLRAVVDSAADEDGLVHVTYDYVNGKLPRAARVAPSDVRLHDAPPPAAGRSDAACTVSSAVSSDVDHYARPPQQNKAAPRPTVAGKKLPLLKKFEDEMKRRSRTITGCL